MTNLSMSCGYDECARGDVLRAHLFNPGYEASIACGDKAYTPPSNVSAFRRDLWELPYYYAEEGDLVIDPTRLPSSSDLEGKVLAPWGWAPELTYSPLSAYVPYTYDEMKLWGSRHNTYTLLTTLHHLYPDVYSSDFLPTIVTSDPGLLDLNNSARYVLKEEFSSSGRGVAFLNGADVRTLLAKRSGRAQTKRLYIELFYDKVSDRGYEFFRDRAGEVRYIGPSDFVTQQGRYLYSHLEHPEGIHQRWRSCPTVVDHDTYVEHLTAALNELPLGSYCGVIGVDTMVYRDSEGKLRLHPCIEVNVRPTMGWLALSLTQRYLPANAVGRFEIQYYPTPDHLKQSLSPQLLSQQPLYLHGKNTKNTLSSAQYLLSSVSDSTHFVAVLSVFA